MMPVLLKPNPCDDPQCRTAWACYGAAQLLDMMGLSYVTAQDGEAYDDSLVIAPASGQICVNAVPNAAPECGPIEPLLRVVLQAELTPDPLELFTPAQSGPATCKTGADECDDRDEGACPPHRPIHCSLPLLGGGCGLGGNRPTGTLYGTDAACTPRGPLLLIDEAGRDSLRISFNAAVFETVGLYLSRFSWPANPGFTGFVRVVDDLWEALEDRWGGRPIVSEWQQVIAALVRHCYRRLGLPMATAWQHPAHQRQVKLHGLLLSHDVDSVYAAPHFRGRGDQSGNSHFNFDRWMALERRFDIRSAFYLFSPDPQHDYWLPNPAYRLSDSAVLRAASSLTEAGWEIAPHALGYRNADEVAAEVARFRQVTGVAPAGTRNHHLKHEAESPAHKAAAGLRYDSTWYAEQTASSFLCGTVLPFAPLDCATCRPLPLWEFPFVIEDGIVSGCYGGEATERSTSDAVVDGARALDYILAHHGYVCFNWHQRVFALRTGRQEEGDSWVTMLEGLMDYYRARARQWWNPLPRELADFWSRRSAVRIEADAGQVQVRNLGASDCLDFVLALDRPLPGTTKAPGLGLWCLPLPLAAGQMQTVQCR